MDDTVLFISAYKSTSYKATNWFSRQIRHIFPQRNKEKLQSLLKKHHLTFVATDENIVSSDGKMRVSTHYDYVHQETTFSFEPKDTANKDHDATSYIKDSGFYINLRHAQSVLADDSYFKINFTFGLEPFLVWINDRMYQVDAEAFMLNHVLFVLFEIINYETGKPLSKDDVCAKQGNYNLLCVHKYQFFNEQQSTSIEMKVPELIFNRICGFLGELTDNHFYAKEYSFVHDTLVFSNSIDNISDYLCKLIGVKHPVSVIKDISTVETYEYYPQDGFSIISNYDPDTINTTLYIGIILESIKLYIYVFQISNLHDGVDIHKTVRDDIYLQNLFYSPDLPIETHNLLNYIQESESYRKHAEALRLKIQYLTVQNDLKKNRNATALNILLYIISLLGAIAPLDVIEKQFGVPFEYSFILVIVLFILGGLWGIVEYHNNRNL